jgi:putative endonuclease
VSGAHSDRRQDAERAGRRAEFLVRIAYLLRGYQILASRFRASGGEVDLIVRRGKLIAFVEVKLRRSQDLAILAVTPKNRRRLEAAAARFLALRPHFGEFAVRYDIAAVSGLRIKLVTDAWRAEA